MDPECALTECHGVVIAVERLFWHPDEVPALLLEGVQGQTAYKLGVGIAL